MPQTQLDRIETMLIQVLLNQANLARNQNEIAQLFNFCGSRATSREDIIKSIEGTSEDVIKNTLAATR